MRIFSAALALLAACKPATEPAQPSPAAAETIECAAGDGSFARVCEVQREQVATGEILTIRHPDGHFRRLLVTPAGQVSAADGADPAQVGPLSGSAREIAVGSDHYRVPLPAPAS